MVERQIAGVGRRCALGRQDVAPRKASASVTRGDGGRTGDKELVLELVFLRDPTPGPTMRLLERSHVKVHFAPTWLRLRTLCCDGRRTVIGRVFLRQCGGDARCMRAGLTHSVHQQQGRRAQNIP